MSFYMNTISECLDKQLVGLDESILVVGGGKSDRNVFFECGFKNVTISNLDYHAGHKDYSPFSLEYQDAEMLTFEDDKFDWVFTHAVLHHCGSPHKALCEMLRVSKKGVGVFESRDSNLIKLGLKFGLVPEYEIEPSVISGGKFGGYRNTPVPNYVYRWTEREVRKTVNTFIPHYHHEFNFFYGLTVPTQRMSMSKKVLKRVVAKIAVVVLPVFRTIFPKQCNHFAFIVSKKGKLQPWLKFNNDEYSFDTEYAKDEYDPKKYKI